MVGLAAIYGQGPKERQSAMTYVRGETASIGCTARRGPHPEVRRHGQPRASLASLTRLERHNTRHTSVTDVTRRHRRHAQVHGVRTAGTL